MQITPYSIHMGFDQRWFDTLRKEISPSDIGAARILRIERLDPGLFELADAGLVPPDFVTPTNELIQALNETPYPFRLMGWRATPGEIYTYPKNRAYHWQWNVAFRATPDAPHWDHARVGMGLYGPEGEQGTDAYLRFAAFQEKVRARRLAFTTLMPKIGNYREIVEVDTGQGHADAFDQHRPGMPF